MLVNVPRLITAYYTDVPDPSIPAQSVRATPKQKNLLARLSPRQFRYTSLAGETIERVLNRAPGNAAPIGGLKVITRSGWFAARPSGTENIYKIYAESLRGHDHLEHIVEEAQAMVDGALGVKGSPAERASPRKP